MNNKKLKSGDLILVNLPIQNISNAYAIFIDDNTIFNFLGIQKDRKKDIYCYLIENLSENELVIQNNLISNYQKLVLEKANKLNKNSIANYLPGSVLELETWPYHSVYLGKVRLINMRNNECFEGYSYFHLFDDYDDGIKNLDDILKDINDSLNNEFYQRKSKKIFETNLFDIRSKLLKTNIKLVAEINIRFLNNKIIDIQKEGSITKEPFKLVLLDV